MVLENFVFNCASGATLTPSFLRNINTYNDWKGGGPMVPENFVFNCASGATLTPSFLRNINTYNDYKGRGSGNRRFPEKIESEKHNIFIN